MAFAEYIWPNGRTATHGLSSKTRVVNISGDAPEVERFPDWSFDGYRTGQAERSAPDCVLKPVCVVRDPLRAGEHYLVLCEVFNPDGVKHPSNVRGDLRAILARGAETHEAWIGFEQEYRLMRDSRSLGQPEDSGNTGPCYCAVGADRTFGRELAEAHARLCETAGLMLYGLNAEALPGQWQFQIGYRDREDDDPSLLNAADHLVLARYLLQRLAERAGLVVSFDERAAEGGGHGARLHTTFSTSATRAEGGIDAIHDAIKRLAEQHEQHMAAYRGNLSERPPEAGADLEFKAGGCDRDASVRIPLGVEQTGSGYFEDRRPGAGADPYRVAARLAATVFDIDYDPFATLRSAA